VNKESPARRKNYFLRGYRAGFFEMSDEEKRFFDAVDRLSLARFVVPLLVLFIVANSLDVVLTYVAARSGYVFVEYNNLAAALFAAGVSGWIAAVVFKLLLCMAVTIFVLHGLSARKARTYYGKLIVYASFIILVAGDCFGAVILGNNLSQLIIHRVIFV
jgi:hypothetical protein